MRLLYVSLALSISLSACLQPVQADTPSVFAKTIQVSNAIPAAKQALATLAKMYDARDKLKAFHVEYQHRVGPTNIGEITVVGDLQKPNKMNLRLYRDGNFLAQVVNDGITEIFYDANTNRYAQCAAPASYNVTQMLEVAQVVSNAKDVAGTYKIIAGGSLESIQQDTEERNAEMLLYSGILTDPEETLAGAKFLLRTTTPGEVNEWNAYMSAAELTGSNIAGSGMPLNDVEISQTDGDGIKFVYLQLAMDAMSSLPSELRDEVILAVRSDRFPVSSSRCAYEHMTIKPVVGLFRNSVFAWSPPDGAKSTQPVKQEPKFQLIGPAS